MVGEGSGGVTATSTSTIPNGTIPGGRDADGSIPRSGEPLPRSGGGDGDQRSESRSSGSCSDVSSESGTRGAGSSSTSAGTRGVKKGDSAIAKRLARPDYEAEVKQFRLFPQDIIGEWMVKRVVSPFEFYLEFVFDEQIGGGTLAQMNYHKWWPRMQKFYDDPVKRDPLKADHADLHVGHCFVLEEPESQNPNQLNWHRVRILKLDPPRKQALVFYCDIGKRDLVSSSRLFLLDSEFAKYEAHLFRCYLYNVLPAMFGKTLLDWSVDAVAYFKDLMSCWEGKRVSGVVLARSGTIIQRCIPDVYQNLGIVLFDTGSSKDKELSCTVNALLVKSGHATATGLFSTCPHQLGRPEWCEGERFNEVDFKRQHPHLNQVKSPPSCIPNILRTDDYNRAVQLYAAATKPEITWHPTEYKEKLRREANEKEKGWLPTTVKERIVHVNINYSKGPNYIMMNIARESESKAMLEMQDAIVLTLRDTRPLTEIEPGQFVAYKVEKKGVPNSRSCHRGLILSSMENPDFFNVLAVDYGNETIVPRSNIFKLENYFLGIPSFVIRAHLAVPGVVPGKSGSGWSALAKDHFVTYLLTYNSEKPAYFVFRPSGSEWIELDSFRQEVVFDTKTKKWKADRLPTCGNDGDELPSLDLKKYPLLKSLHRSVGVHIKYEVKVESSVWHFIGLHDQLSSQNEITVAKKARTDDRMHLDILDEWEFDVLRQAKI